MTNHSYHRIGIVGSGRVARAISHALAACSAAPVLFWGRTPWRARHAATAVGGEAVTDLEFLAQSCDLVLLAVSDDAIGPLAQALSSALMPSRAAAPFYVHMSGGGGVAVLAPLRAAGASIAAIHPAMTFTGDPLKEVARMKGAVFAITALDPGAIAQARGLVALLGGVAEIVEEEHRPLYHAALSHAANHMVTLITGASDALAVAGVENPAALLAPLVRATLENSLSKGFEALSGPLLRGDARTIDHHLTALAQACPDLLPAYRAMAQATLARLERDNRHPTSRDLRDLLDETDAHARQE